MKTGAYISGSGHLILILWAVLGGVIFKSDSAELPETTDVRLLSEAEFLALAANEPEPLSAQDIEGLIAPPTEENETNASPGDEKPDLAPRPDIAEPVDPDAQPEKPDLTIPEADVETTTPDAPVAPASEDMVTLLPPALTPGRPQDAPRVAALPVPEALPSAQEAPDFVPPETAVPDDAPEETPIAPEEPSAAPLEATTEIVTEATELEPEGARVSGFPPDCAHAIPYPLKIRPRRNNRNQQTAVRKLPRQTRRRRIQVQIYRLAHPLALGRLIDWSRHLRTAGASERLARRRPLLPLLLGSQ